MADGLDDNINPVTNPYGVKDPDENASIREMTWEQQLMKIFGTLGVTNQDVTKDIFSRTTNPKTFMDAADNFYRYGQTIAKHRDKLKQLKKRLLSDDEISGDVADMWKGIFHRYEQAFNSIDDTVNNVYGKSLSYNAHLTNVGNALTTLINEANMHSENANRATVQRFCQEKYVGNYYVQAPPGYEEYSMPDAKPAEWISSMSNPDNPFGAHKVYTPWQVNPDGKPTVFASHYPDINDKFHDDLSTSIEKMQGIFDTTVSSLAVPDLSKQGIGGGNGGDGTNNLQPPPAYDPNNINNEDPNKNINDELNNMQDELNNANNASNMGLKDDVPPNNLPVPFVAPSSLSNDQLKANEKALANEKAATAAEGEEGALANEEGLMSNAMGAGRGMPYYPMGGGGGMAPQMGQDSADKQRNVWINEDKKVWAPKQISLVYDGILGQDNIE